MRNLEGFFLATMDEPTQVCFSQPLAQVVPVPGVFIASLAARLSGDGVKVYLTLLLLAGSPSYLYQTYTKNNHNLIDEISRMQQLSRDKTISALDELKNLGLAAQTPRFLKDTNKPDDWKLERDEFYRYETSPVITVESVPVRIMSLLDDDLRTRSEVSASLDTIASREEAVAIEMQSLITANYRVAQEVLATIGTKEMRKCELWLQRYGYGPDMVRSLLEYCMSRGKSDINYADTVAREWFKSGVKTPEDAQIHIAKYEELKGKYSRIRRQMGRHDGLTQDERDMYDKWRTTWGFDEEVILTACKATTKARIPSFAYIDSILDSWYQAGIKTVAEAEAEMEKSKAARSAKTTGAGYQKGNQRNISSRPSGIPGSNRRSEDAKYYADYAKLEEALLDAGDDDEEDD